MSEASIRRKEIALAKLLLAGAKKFTTAGGYTIKAVDKLTNCEYVIMRVNAAGRIDAIHFYICREVLRPQGGWELITDD